MGVLRWIILVASFILIIAMCKLNFHQRYFNFFILGLFLLNFVVIVMFWLTCKWQGLENAESMKMKQAMSGPG
ncbi:MAG: hypothetical protein JRG73_14935 [Deltaproteobacteria bacterium]|nr:hypothetical protein [Deltaproteobacteria bacterium]MBW2308219.1 hypothetical protein [Deltaproteobacteria bacterium]